MIIDSTKLIKGQSLKIEISQVKDRLPKNVLEEIHRNSDLDPAKVFWDNLEK